MFLHCTQTDYFITPSPPPPEVQITKCNQFKIARNAQSWHCWYFCITSSGSTVIENSWETNQFQCKQTFVMVLWIQMEEMDFSILLIFKFTQYKNANNANFVYCGKTRPCIFVIYRLPIQCSMRKICFTGQSMCLSPSNFHPGEKRVNHYSQVTVTVAASGSCSSYVSCWAIYSRRFWISCSTQTADK